MRFTETNNMYNIANVSILLENHFKLNLDKLKSAKFSIIRLKNQQDPKLLQNKSYFCYLFEIHFGTIDRKFCIG